MSEREELRQKVRETIYAWLTRRAGKSLDEAAGEVADMVLERAAAVAEPDLESCSCDECWGHRSAARAIRALMKETPND